MPVPELPMPDGFEGRMPIQWTIADMEWLEQGWTAAAGHPLSSADRPSSQRKKDAASGVSMKGAQTLPDTDLADTFRGWRRAVPGSPGSPPPRVHDHRGRDHSGSGLPPLLGFGAAATHSAHGWRCGGPAGLELRAGGPWSTGSIRGARPAAGLTDRRGASVFATGVTARARESDARARPAPAYCC